MGATPKDKVASNRAESDSEPSESGYQRDDYWQAAQEERASDEGPKTGQGLAFQDDDEKAKAAESPGDADADADANKGNG